MKSKTNIVLVHGAWADGSSLRKGPLFWLAIRMPEL